MRKTYSCKQDGERFYFYKGLEKLETPKGNEVCTIYPKLADRLLEDLNKYGAKPGNPSSLVTFHYTMIDLHSNLPIGELQKDVAFGLFEDTDWTLSCNIPNPYSLMDWWAIFGRPENQIEKANTWILELSRMKLCATCVLGAAIQSVNIPFIIATIIEEDELKPFSKIVYKSYPCAGEKSILKYFENFKFYYSIEDSN